MSNRPSVVDVWANALRLSPAFILNLQKQEVAEYGHAYEDPAIGTFQSRLRPAELAEEDRTRGDAGLGVDRAAPGTACGAWFTASFLRSYPAYRDPYVHEARVSFVRARSQFGKNGSIYGGPTPFMCRESTRRLYPLANTRKRPRRKMRNCTKSKPRWRCGNIGCCTPTSPR